MNFPSPHTNCMHESISSRVTAAIHKILNMEKPMNVNDFYSIDSSDADWPKHLQSSRLRQDLRTICEALNDARQSATVGQDESRPHYMLRGASIVPEDRLKLSVPVTSQTAREDWSQIRALVAMDNLSFAIMEGDKPLAVLSRHPAFLNTRAETYRRIAKKRRRKTRVWCRSRR